MKVEYSSTVEEHASCLEIIFQSAPDAEGVTPSPRQFGKRFPRVSQTVSSQRKDAFTVSSLQEPFDNKLGSEGYVFLLQTPKKGSSFVLLLEKPESLRVSSSYLRPLE